MSVTLYGLACKGGCLKTREVKKLANISIQHDIVENSQFSKLYTNPDQGGGPE
jgi:hypothetical protein